MSIGYDDSGEQEEELARCDACGKLYKHCRCEQPEQDDEIVIKRYDIKSLDQYTGAILGSSVRESHNGDFVEYADIAPLEAKAAMFDEIIQQLETWADKGFYDDIPYIRDLLTRARAMEGGK